MEYFRATALSRYAPEELFRKFLKNPEGNAREEIIQITLQIIDLNFTKTQSYRACFPINFDNFSEQYFPIKSFV